jgi:hypothetical protein
MKTKYIYCLLTLVSFLTLTTSCIDDDDDYDSMYNMSYDLCSYNWYDSYINGDGLQCEQTLRFYNDGTGTDYTTIYYGDGMSDNRKTNFYWQWDSSRYSDSPTLVLTYPNGTDYYDNVWIGNGYLRCVLNGEDISFRAI